MRRYQVTVGWNDDKEKANPYGDRKKGKILTPRKERAQIICGREKSKGRL